MTVPLSPYVEAAASPSRYRVKLWALVLLAAGIPNRIDEVAAGYSLVVPEERLDQAVGEIGLFIRENRDWPPVQHLGEVRSAEERNPPTVLMMGALLVFYVITGPFSAHSEWFSRGAVDSRAILENGEWWRLLTALTLHSDPVHLVSNLLIGGMVIHFLSLRFGAGPGWLLMVIAGVIGNYANVLAHGPGHLSVGFSTAVFAAIGLLCGSQIKLLNLRAILLPLGAGGALLAMLGSSGERTDLGAHLWGLLAGLLLGFCWSWLAGALLKGHYRGGGWFLGLVVLSICLAWYRAFAF